MERETVCFMIDPPKECAKCKKLRRVWRRPENKTCAECLATISAWEKKNNRHWHG